MGTSFRLRECEITYRTLPGAVPSRSVSSSQDVYAMLRERYACRVTESLLVLCMNARNRVTCIHETCKGGANAVHVSVADLFRAAILAGAPAIILAHNHPSGATDPSPEDLELTARAAQAGKLLGIRVLDHVILGESDYYSMLDSGLMTRM